jgi:hypothetical protein
VQGRSYPNKGSDLLRKQRSATPYLFILFILMPIRNFQWVVHPTSRMLISTFPSRIELCGGVKKAEIPYFLDLETTSDLQLDSTILISRGLHRSKEKHIQPS